MSVELHSDDSDIELPELPAGPQINENLELDGNQQSPSPLLIYRPPSDWVLMVRPLWYGTRNQLATDDPMPCEDLVDYVRRRLPFRSPDNGYYAFEFICYLMPSQNLLWRVQYRVLQPIGSPTPYKIFDDPCFPMFLMRFSSLSSPIINPLPYWTPFIHTVDETPQLDWMPDGVSEKEDIDWRIASVSYTSYSLPAFPGFPDFVPLEPCSKGLSICKMCDRSVYPNSMYNLIDHIAGHHEPYAQRYQCLKCPKMTLLMIEMHWHFTRTHSGHCYYVDKGGDELWATWRTAMSDCFPNQTAKFDECVERWRGA